MKYFRENKFVVIVIIIILLMGVAGCADGTETALPEPAAIAEVSPESEPAETAKPVLNVYNWDDYMDPQILADFEEEYDVTINYQVFENDEVLFEEIKAGTSYDLIFPSDYNTLELIQQDLLASLNKENIPNLKNIDSLFVNPVYDPGNRHCIPYQWGTTGFGYNTEVVGDIENLEDVFTPQFAGRVGFLNDPREAFAPALLHLGYSPNTTNKAEIDEAYAFLKDHINIIGGLHNDDGQDFLAAGTYDIMYEYSGDVLLVMEDNPNLQYKIPTSGSIIWVDNVCIPHNAQNKELAETFLNYLLDPEVGAALSTYLQYGSPNQPAVELLPEEVRNNPAIYPPSEVQEVLYTLIDLDETTTTYYKELWAELSAEFE